MGDRLVPKEHSGGSSNTSEGSDGLPSPKSQHFPLPTKASCAFAWWLFGVVTAPAPNCSLHSRAPTRRRGLAQMLLLTGRHSGLQS